MQKSRNHYEKLASVRRLPLEEPKTRVKTRGVDYEQRMVRTTLKRMVRAMMNRIVRTTMKRIVGTMLENDEDHHV